MVTRCLTLWILTIINFFIICGKDPGSKKIRSEYVYNPPTSMSLDNATREALKRARLKALEDEYGTRIFRVANSEVINETDRTYSKVFVHGSNEVMGEWICDTGEPEISIDFTDGMLIIKVTVEGYCRPLPDNMAIIDTKILRNGSEDKYESDVFTPGDDVYLAVQTPVDGFITVFWLDYNSDVVTRMLPYKSQRTPSLKIEAHSRHLFFADSTDDKFSNDLPDSYIVSSDSEESVYNEIVILFSPTPIPGFSKLLPDSSGLLNAPLTEFDLWQAQVRLKNPSINKIIKSLTINPT